MLSVNKQVHRLNRIAIGFFLSALLVFPLLQCKSTTSSTGVDAYITVTNSYGEALNIFMDSVFQFLLENKDSKIISHVTQANHKLEAYKVSTSTKVDSTEIDVVQITGYTWTINGPPRIQVTNNYGETLSIYMDYKYQFDLVDTEDRWIFNVTFADHFLQAIRPSTGKEVASTTITVDANQAYTWSVQ